MTTKLTNQFERISCCQIAQSRLLPKIVGMGLISSLGMIPVSTFAQTDISGIYLIAHATSSHSVLIDRARRPRTGGEEIPRGKALVRTYYPVSISDLAAGRNSHTHIRVTGKVVLVKHEADGDLHIRLSDGKHWIVAECIPTLPCPEPRVGQALTVEGISRFDAKHRWYEVHPVERGFVNVVP